MNREHNWAPTAYQGVGVLQCLNCPIQRRWMSGRYQWRPSNNAIDWNDVSAEMPECTRSEVGDGMRSRDEYTGTQKTPDLLRTTESLEAEFKEVSDRIAADPQRFQQIRDELARRRKVSDEQPPMDVVTVDSQKQADSAFQENLVLKVTSMEAEQAQLVVECETAREAARRAEERLALVVKNLGKREPITRDNARVLAIEHKYKRGTALDGIDEWVVDAIIEASK